MSVTREAFKNKLYEILEQGGTNENFVDQIMALTDKLVEALNATAYKNGLADMLKNFTPQSVVDEFVEQEAEDSVKTHTIRPI